MVHENDFYCIFYKKNLVIALTYIDKVNYHEHLCDNNMY
jgi:hypothetical protein